MGAFACSAGCCHQVSLAVAAYYAGVNQHGVHGCRGKGKGHHHAVVQTIVLLFRGDIVEFYKAMMEIGLSQHCGTQEFFGVVYLEEVFPFFCSVHAMIAASNIEHAYFRKFSMFQQLLSQGYGKDGGVVAFACKGFEVMQ
jgi:hypothetical protein